MINLPACCYSDTTYDPECIFVDEQAGIHDHLHRESSRIMISPNYLGARVLLTTTPPPPFFGGSKTIRAAVCLLLTTGCYLQT